jgi:hypothetical protein
MCHIMVVVTPVFDVRMINIKQHPDMWPHMILNIIIGVTDELGIYKN